MATEWEYCDYAWEWHDSPWVRCFDHTEAAAREYFWSLCRDKVEVELEDYIAEGWEPVKADLTRGHGNRI